MSYQSGREAFMQGVRALLPLTPGVIPFGLVTGIMAIKLGMTPFTAMGMTLLFYSGSAQMVALQLLGTGVVPVAIVATALVINLRFVMYSASLAPHQHRIPRRRLWPLTYMLSDQSYALCTLGYSSGELGRFAHYYYAGTAFTMWLSWQLSVLAGICLGTGIPESWSLNFAIPLSFLALLVPGIRSRATLSAAVVGGVIAVWAVDLPYNLGLIVASVAGVAAGLAVESWCQAPSNDNASGRA
ncbi:AzlC family ABC transporter permease [Pseudomonas lijiangensis]|uniref:AzlC family ABC transporter permease n=1 Tax=Pseudomonas lijiangensis TaxID=2995658 RepID=UPI0031BB6951